MDNLPELVVDEIYRHVHKSCMREVNKEYHDNFRLTEDVQELYMRCYAGGNFYCAAHFRLYVNARLYHYVFLFSNHECAGTGQARLPRRYFYTSGMNSRHGFIE